MIKILHRVNNLDELQKIDKSYGVEVDVHAYGRKLIVHHNAFEVGPDLSDWLSVCGQRLVILNIKEEGIESRVRDMALKFGIKNFMLLDLSFPALVKMSNKGESRIAIRVSEYESVENALLIESKIDLYLSISNKPDFTKIGKKIQAKPKGFMTQVVQNIEQAQNLSDNLKGFSIIPIILFPSEKNEKSAKFLNLDLASYSQTFNEFVKRVHEITEDVLITSPNDFKGLDKFLEKQII